MRQIFIIKHVYQFVHYANPFIFPTYWSVYQYQFVKKKEKKKRAIDISKAEKHFWFTVATQC